MSISPLSTPQSRSAAPPQQAVALAVADPPEVVARLPIGARLPAIVVASGSQSLLSVTAGDETVNLRVQGSLPEGASVELVIAPRGARVLVHLTQLSAAAASAPASRQAPAAGSEPASSTPSSPSLPSGDAAKGAARGVVITPAPTLSPPTATTVIATLVHPVRWIPSITERGPGATATHPAPGTGSEAVTGAPTHRPAGTSTGGTVLPAGSALLVRVVASEPSHRGDPMPTTTPRLETLAPGQILRGIVEGGAVAGQVKVQTSHGPLTLSLAATLPRGGVITLEVIGPAAFFRAEALPAALGALEPGRFRSALSPVLDDAIQALQTTGHVTELQRLSAVVPRPNSQLALSILSFLQSLRGGDLRAWLGEGVAQVLQRERPEIWSRLGEGFKPGPVARDEASGLDWRIVHVPLLADTRIADMRLLYRHRDSEQRSEGDDQDDGARFVVEVRLSRLGRLQLDGLVRDGGRRLNLMVRSESPLGGDLRQEIRSLFNTIGETVGLTGGVDFCCGKSALVNVAVDGGTPSNPGLIV